MPKKTTDKKTPERRDGCRVNRVVAVSHRLAVLRRAKPSADWSLSTTKNMSHSGLLFLSAVPYRKNAVLELQVVMSGIIDLFNGQARVMRIQEVGNTSFEIGVKFLPSKPLTRNAKTYR